MRRRVPCIALVICTLWLASSCSKEDEPYDGAVASGPELVLLFKFDSTQARLNSVGQPAPLPVGHAAQSPLFGLMSAHYIEFAPNSLTTLGAGEVVYTASESNAGGDLGIDFDQARLAGNGEEFLRIPLSELAAGSYEWLRVSLAFQKYEIDIRVNSPVQLDLQGTLASFVGYNTYINDLTINDSTISINDDRLQGFWALETAYSLTTGQAPAGATTVPNPIFADSPIPAGSCVVTGEFVSPLIISGNETDDVVIEVSLSTKQSFEWIDDGDGLFEPLDGDQVVDMGIRGMIPSRQ